MALILRGKTLCALCHKVIKEKDEVVASTHFNIDAEDPLWRFSDAALHKNCFLEWNQRAAFVEKYNESVESLTSGNGAPHYMDADGSIVTPKRVNKQKD